MEVKKTRKVILLLSFLTLIFSLALISGVTWSGGTTTTTTDGGNASWNESYADTLYVEHIDFNDFWIANLSNLDNSTFTLNYNGSFHDSWIANLSNLDNSSFLNLNLWTSTATTLYNDTANVGIGTNLPSSVLEVNGSILNLFNVSNGTDPVLLANTYGRVGIRIGAPQTPLHIFQSANSNAPNSNAGLFIERGSGGAGIQIMSDVSGYGFIDFGNDTFDRAGGLFYNFVTDRMDFYAGGSAKFTVDTREYIVNEVGADVDSRWETDNDVYAFTMLGSDGRLSIGEPVGSAHLSLSKEIDTGYIDVASSTDAGANGNILHLDDDGDLGIGHREPMMKLVVNGSINATEDVHIGDDAIIAGDLDMEGNFDVLGSIRMSDGTNPTIIFNDRPNFWSGDGQYFFLTGAGTNGLMISLSSVLTFINYNAHTYFRSRYDNDFVIGNYTEEFLFIDGLGNVSVGGRVDTTPDYTLEVNGTIGTINFTSTGYVNVTEDVCLDDGTCLSDSGEATKEIFYPSTAFTPEGESSGSAGDFVYAVLGSTDEFSLNMFIPNDFTSLTGVYVVVIADATETVQFDVVTDFAAAGETYNTHSDSIVNGQQAVTAGEIEELDISDAFTGIGAGDYIGMEFASDTNTLASIGVRIKYT